MSIVRSTPLDCNIVRIGSLQSCIAGRLVGDCRDSSGSKYDRLCVFRMAPPTIPSPSSFPQMSEKEFTGGEKQLEERVEPLKIMAPFAIQKPPKALLFSAISIYTRSGPSVRTLIISC